MKQKIPNKLVKYSPPLRGDNLSALEADGTIKVPHGPCFSVTFREDLIVQISVHDRMPWLMVPDNGKTNEGTHNVVVSHIHF